MGFFGALILTIVFIFVYAWGEAFLYDEAYYNYKREKEKMEELGYYENKSQYLGIEKYIQKERKADKAKEDFIKLTESTRNTAFNNQFYTENSNAAALGGIAAGISGSHAVGVATALKAEHDSRLNTMHVRENAKKQFDSLSSLETSEVLYELKKGIGKANETIDKLKPYYIEVPESAVSNISFSKIDYTFTKYGHMLLDIKLKSKRYFKYGDEHELDGFLKIIVLNDGKNVGSAIVIGKGDEYKIGGNSNIGFDGATYNRVGALPSFTEPKMKFKKTGEYSFEIVPIKIWGMRR